MARKARRGILAASTALGTARNAEGATATRQGADFAGTEGYATPRSTTAAEAGSDQAAIEGYATPRPRRGRMRM